MHARLRIEPGACEHGSRWRGGRSGSPTMAELDAAARAEDACQPLHDGPPPRRIGQHTTRARAYHERRSSTKPVNLTLSSAVWYEAVSSGQGPMTASRAAGTRARTAGQISCTSKSTA